ncbi:MULTISPECIES: adenylate/guanylate cyclase domain-containing protein [Leptospira]|uniref:Adenylate/guanylate cyclase domain-containing protein n=1 Tax=Leptospira kirschneri serovar Pomona TaxID=561005 RepID=A0A1T1DYZ1_9LEPT|nr:MULTISPECIES: adenylate/guanylate cyclase domain-containing protein [Leptospira]EMK06886.1 7TM diverse intracellular signaling [Leptospira kirschneri]KXZ24840.1 guanylate cyclase [Leptospira kirschneri]KXZ33228.1 guanylate cyclase [Leptospira sp. ZV016]OOV45863.1 adenylate/guanylate cyclase domain-containing protein [Leptospira kirschneri serovar Pomona]
MIRFNFFQRQILFLLGIFFVFNHCTQDSEPPHVSAISGVIDLTSWNFEQHGPVALQGDWIFRWKEFIKNPKIDSEKNRTMPVPKAWTRIQEPDGKNYPGTGIATYFLKVILPENLSSNNLAILAETSETAYEVWIDDNKIGTQGVPGETADTSTPEWNVKILPFQIDKKEFQIRIPLSNFYHARGGLTARLILGDEDQIIRLRERRMTMDVFLLGFLVAMALYHFTLYFLRKKDVALLYFGTICFVFCFREISTGQNLIQVVFPGISYNVHMRIVYLSFYLLTPITAAFLRALFPEELKKEIYYGIVFISSIFSLIVVSQDPVLFTETIELYYLFTFFCFAVGFYVLTLALIRKKPGAIAILVGMLAVFLSYSQDIFYTKRIIPTFILAPFGLIALIFSEAYLLAKRYSIAFNAVEDMSESLKKINSSYRLFVPKELLKILNKHDILDIKLGDIAEEEMSLLYNEIRTFSDISEKITGKENFEFINSFLGKVGPVIRERDGFIDKYFGEAFLALFPPEPEKALESAIEIQRILREFNRERIANGKDPIRSGSGIHTGPILLGTIGETERMESTVISSSVNVASKIVQLSRTYESSLLITDSTLFRLTNSSEYFYRVVDRIQIRDQRSIYTVLEVLNGLPENLIDSYMKTREEFEHGILLFREKHFEEACLVFNRILEKNRVDQAARVYLEKSVHNCRFGVPENWQGITLLED